MTSSDIEIRECKSLGELEECVELQRTVFGLPDLELSPVRHLVVTVNSGGFVLGAFRGGELVGFVLTVAAILRGEKAYYSHMTAVRQDLQGHGLGATLKWAQRDHALNRGVGLIKWTFEPWRSRNAFFNVEKLGATIGEYARDYYGIDYVSTEGAEKKAGLSSDRLMAEWQLRSPKVEALSTGDRFVDTDEPVLAIAGTPNWTELVERDVNEALIEQGRLRTEFESAFARGLVVRAFRRDPVRPEYLLFAS